MNRTNILEKSIGKKVNRIVEKRFCLKANGNPLSFWMEAKSVDGDTIEVQFIITSWDARENGFLWKLKQQKIVLPTSK